MRIIFSESPPDYDHYIFPYAVWAVPEKNDIPPRMFNEGFLPAGHGLEKYYLCRHTRVDLQRFSPSSENRRILRKGENISLRLFPREEFEFTPERTRFCLDYFEKRIGPGVMDEKRFHSLVHSPVTSHILVFHDHSAEKEVGYVTLFLYENDLAYYYYSFYDLNHPNKNLGMIQMTQSVSYFKKNNYRHIYLGSCYTKSSLYKSQFQGFEFFNGFRWSDNIKELKKIIQITQNPMEKHLLEMDDFNEEFYSQLDKDELFKLYGKKITL